MSLSMTRGTMAVDVGAAAGIPLSATPNGAETLPAAFQNSLVLDNTASATAAKAEDVTAICRTILEKLERLQLPFSSPEAFFCRYARKRQGKVYPDKKTQLERLGNIYRAGYIGRDAREVKEASTNQEAAKAAKNGDGQKARSIHFADDAQYTTCDRYGAAELLSAGTSTRVTTKEDRGSSGEHRSELEPMTFKALSFYGKDDMITEGHILEAFGRVLADFLMMADEQFVLNALFDEALEEIVQKISSATLESSLDSLKQLLLEKMKQKSSQVTQEDFQGGCAAAGVGESQSEKAMIKVNFLMHYEDVGALFEDKSLTAVLKMFFEQKIEQ